MSEEIFVDTEGDGGQLSFDSFDLMLVLRKAKPLLGSQGFEYELSEEFRKLDPKERLKRQRGNLKKSLGLDDGDDGDNIEAMFDASARRRRHISFLFLGTISHGFRSSMPHALCAVLYVVPMVVGC